MSILEAYELNKKYGEGETQVHALKDAELKIEKGEFVAVVGPSGSGKSTLLHLLAGLDTPSYGRVYINDRNIVGLPEKELSIFRRRNIGFIFQFFNLLPILSLEENVILPIQLDEQKVDWDYINELLNTLGLEERRDHVPGALSGGQQQRAAIARALSTKPAIIFADEPTGNLDTKSSEEVLKLLKESIKKYNQTLVLITHDPEVAKHADRIITLEDGKIVEDRVIASV
ncbi:MAG: ABC transporter ATP-binding protein [Firmicutes bacterium]|nr:ABC transporter ATP-binding protein [Bacillota bacterium]